MSQQMCKNCVNFIQLNEGYYLCDFDYWDETSEDDAILYCAELFECTHFENINDFEN